MDNQAFWLVWSPQGIRPPSYRHHSEAAARTEAERLARNSPGAEFFTMRAVAVAKRVDVVTTNLSDPSEPTF